MNFIVDKMFLANKYFNDQEPWRNKNDIKRLNTIIYTSLELIRKISILLYPVIPDTSIKALSIFNINEKNQIINEYSLDDKQLFGIDNYENGENVNMYNVYDGITNTLDIDKNIYLWNGIHPKCRRMTCGSQLWPCFSG